MTTKTVSNSNAPLIESRDQLIASFARGEKPKDQWRIGTEHEKFVYSTVDHHAPSWGEPAGIRALLIELEQHGWKPVEEGGNIIALTGADGSVSLEPAGQFELSGAPLENLHETCAETGRHLEQVKAAGEKLGIGFLGLGMWPDKRRDELPIMPKGRYAIMLRHMPRVGTMGLDMMLRTCTIQVNLDYASEADMVKKFRVGLALQPLATALFANSPFTEGTPNGYLSYRSHIWSDTDPAAVEEVLGNTNAQSTLKLGQARGVVLLAAAEKGLIIGEYHPSTVKKAVVGTGGAEKRQIQAMMAVLLPGAKLAGPDAADALAVAITHAHHLASAQGMARRARITA